MKTSIPSREVTFIWSVKDFNLLPHRLGEVIQSPSFSVGRCTCSLFLFPRGLRSEEYVSVFLNTSKDCDCEVSTISSICLIRDEGNPDTCEQENTSTVIRDSTWGFYTIAKRDVLLTRLHILPNNTLTIKCSVVLQSVKKGSLCRCSQESPDDDFELYNEEECEILSRDFLELLRRGIQSDMRILVQDGKFDVHKAILECRCPHLIAQLKQTDVPNEYYLPNIESRVFQTLLQYLYAGTFEVCNMYKEICIASQTFDLPELKNTSIVQYTRSIEASTEIEVSHFSFRWTISDFSKLQLDQELIYPLFCYSSDEWDKLEIVLTITQDTNQSNNLYLKCRREHSDVDNIISAQNVQWKFRDTMCSYLNSFVVCIISISENDSSSIPVKKYEHVFKCQNWMTQLASGEGLSNLIFNDSLFMCFDITINGLNSNMQKVMAKVNSKAQSASGTIVKNFELLHRDYMNLFNKPNFSDVVLCVEDKMYHAHKAILWARWPVFAKMFEHDTMEKENSVVTIKEVNSATVLSILRYIYCGFISEMDISEAVRMCSTDDKYELLPSAEKRATFQKYFIDGENEGGISFLTGDHSGESLECCSDDDMQFYGSTNEVLLSKQCVKYVKQ